MLTRIAPVIRAAGSVSRLQATSVRAMGGGNFKTDLQVVEDHGSTLSDMPVPSGSWQQAYSKQQTKYNMQLGAAFGLLIVTYIALKQSGTLMYHDVSDYKKLNIDPSKPLE